MKKNRMMRLASILLVCVLLTTSVISGTFAKYTSSATATDSARVAKWSVKVGTVDIANPAGQTVSIDLFNTVNGFGEGDETGNDTNVKDGSNEVIIAPGTSGSFELTVTNASEVTAIVDITFTVAKPNNLPIMFKLGDGEWSADVSALNITAAELAYEGDTATKTVTIHWKWDFDTSTDQNGKDTELGVAAVSADQLVTVTATITATQKN